MRKRTARLQHSALIGEPDLTSLLGDPMMLSLWRADRINPDDAKRLFANTTERLQRRNKARQRLHEGRRSTEPAGAEDDQSYAFA